MSLQDNAVKIFDFNGGFRENLKGTHLVVEGKGGFLLVERRKRLGQFGSKGSKIVILWSGCGKMGKILNKPVGAEGGKVLINLKFRDVITSGEIGLVIDGTGIHGGDKFHDRDAEFFVAV